MDTSNPQDKGDSITLTNEQKETILNQATNSICFINTGYIKGVGFFCLIPNSDFAGLQPVLITSFLNLTQNKILTLLYKNEEKIIDIDESRHIYSNRTCWITIIELKDDEFPPEIFLILDNLINNTDKEEILNEQYINQDIYLIHYDDEKNPIYSYDKIKEIKDFLIKGYCPNETILIGSPILNLNSFNVIGVHKGKSDKTKSNMGLILRVLIKEYNKSKEGSTKQKKNTELLNIVKKTDEPKSIIELISQLYLKDKDDLVEKLNEFLIISEVTDDYRSEVITKFKTNITKVFDTKTDTNTLLNFLSKIKGLPNLIVNICLKTENGESKQMFYVNGKIDLVDNTFSFENSDIFGFGEYVSDKDEDYEFISFRPQNTQLYLKIKIDCLYVMCYREGVEVKLLLKIKQSFMDNPIVCLSWDDIKLEEEQGTGKGANEEDEEEDYIKVINNKENIDEIFEKQTAFKNIDIKELLIYKIDD